MLGASLVTQADGTSLLVNLGCLCQGAQPGLTMKLVPVLVLASQDFQAMNVPCLATDLSASSFCAVQTEVWDLKLIFFYQLAVSKVSCNLLILPTSTS